MRRDWWLSLTLAVVLLSTACGQPLPATVGIERYYSHGGPLRDHVSYVDHLRGKEYEVEPVADVRQPFLRAEGTVLRVSGRDLKSPVELQSYNYDDTDLGEDGLNAAEEDASKIGPDGQPRAMSILWAGQPHFYRKERVIVLYLGEDKVVLDLLADLLGPQFAGGSTDEASCSPGPREPVEQPPLNVLWEFWPQTLAEAEERATAVVLARVTGVESPPEGARRTSFGGRRITLEVVRPLQGTPDKAIWLFWGWTEEQYNENDPPYRPCEEYVLFLEPKADEKGTHLVISPLGRYRVQEGKLQPVAKQADGIPVPSWVRELRGTSVGYLEQELANPGKVSHSATSGDLADFYTSEMRGHTSSRGLGASGR